MKLSTKARYAVMSLVDLAAQDNTKPMGLQEISDSQEISLNYLEQIFVKLRQAGLVDSVRGPGGGYLLAKPAKEICIADVFAAVEEPLHTTRCGPESHEGCRANLGKCSTHDLWAAMGAEMQRFLANVTLDDVVNRRIRKELYAA